VLNSQKRRFPARAAGAADIIAGWELHFGLLQAYHAEHGHCDVPRSYHAHHGSGDAPAPELHDWCAPEKQIRGSGGSLEPPGPLPTHLYTVYVECSECLPTRLNPLAERTLLLPGARSSGCASGASTGRRRRLGLGRIVALHHRSSNVPQIR
jgi:hypothetical protein